MLFAANVAVKMPPPAATANFSDRYEQWDGLLEAAKNQIAMKTEFSDDQFECVYPDGMEYHWWNLARCGILAKEVSACAGSVSSVLEVGCGRGLVVKRLREAGIDCSGVELADVRPIQAAAQHIRVGTDAVDLPESERQRYDTILLLDVIEHIPEPVPFLQNLAAAFPNLARVIVTVPARQELWSNYDEFYGHYRRYTPEMLKTLSHELSWKLNRKSYFFHLVYPPAWLTMKLKKDRRIQFDPPRGASRLIHRVVSYAMICDYYLFPRQLVGTSVIGCFQVG